MTEDFEKSGESKSFGYAVPPGVTRIKPHAFEGCSYTFENFTFFSLQRTGKRHAA
jgi:hypothetical protein